MNVSRRALVIDHDRDCCASIATLLEVTGKYLVTVSDSAEEAIAGEMAGFDVILLNVDGLGEGAVESCIRLRQRQAGAVIVLTSASDDGMLLVQGLRAGADDFVRKPILGSEVLARLDARLRHHSVRAGSTVTVGRFTFHRDKRLLVDERRHMTIMLAEKEAQLLWHLYLGNGDVVSRTALLHGVWGLAPAMPGHTVATHVYRLRQKMEADPAMPTVILTERGGYRLAGFTGGRTAPLSVPLRPTVGRFAV